MRHHVIALLAAGLLTGAVGAQATSTATPLAPANGKPATQTAAAKPGRAPVARTARSLDCSRQADGKGLHGKPRKQFMSSCKKA